MNEGNLRVGRATCERCAQVLEQQLGAVWAAVLESHGYEPGAGFRVMVDGVWLVPAPVNGPEAPPAVDGPIRPAAVAEGG